MLIGLFWKSFCPFPFILALLFVDDYSLKSSSASQKLGMGPLNKIIETLDEVKKKKLMDIVASVTGAAPPAGEMHHHAL
jgi:hypothetical protein